MKKSLFYVLVWFISASVWQSCANPLPLTGGPKDETAPELDWAVSTPNQQVKFAERKIKLYFDEYVNLQNPGKQIVISPPLEYTPKIKSRLKEVSFELHEEEVLKENVTYVINFGNSIKDYTEGNAVENYTFVFSTGDYIDSLSISGIVEDVQTKEPVKDVLVGLYTSLEDSIIYKERPFYFAKTVDGGRFKIKNLRTDTFKIAAFTDENSNFLYDPESEKIAFLDTLIQLTDSSDISLNFDLFKEEQPTQYKSYTVPNKGVAVLEFNQEPTDTSITLLNTITTFTQITDNKLKLWYAPASLRSFQFTAMRASGLDTIKTRINQRNTDTLKQKLTITSFNNHGGIGVHPEDDLVLTFSRPIFATDLSKITLVDTAAQDTLPLTIGELPSMDLIINKSWEGDGVLALTLLPDACTDIFGETHDTISKFVPIAHTEDFGTIKLSAVMDTTRHYIVQLKKGKEEIRKGLLNPIVRTLTFEKIPPGSYTIDVIREDILNGKWDPGSYLERRQSEKTFTFTLEELRPNWILEKEIDLIQDQAPIETSTLQKEEQ